MRVVAASVGPMSDGGPTSQPMRQPVAANSSAEMCQRTVPWRAGNHRYVLPAEPTVMVRSHMPGRDANRTCSSPSNTRLSYWHMPRISLVLGRPRKTRREVRTYHFVRHDDEIMFLSNLCDCLKLGAREHFAYGVVGRVEHDHFRFGGDSFPVCASSPVSG